jgi:tRNA G18 (ribose-2'-O)-methylase SpoU
VSRNLGSTDLKRLHREWRRQAPGRIALLLDSVATPANVGAIIRTAAALRVEEVWVCGRACRSHAGRSHAIQHQEPCRVTTATLSSTAPLPSLLDNRPLQPPHRCDERSRADY